MWVQLEAKLIILMDINKISLPGNLVQPQSYQDFDVLVFLLRYVHTAPDQRCSLPTPLARSISPTWTGWFIRCPSYQAHGQETDKKDTADTEPEDTADTEPEDTADTEPKDKGKHNEDLDLVGQIAKAALGKFLKESFSDDASTSGF
ncbi:hypothetical protein L3X38_039575 [Prunus dulcis]|uniref:Uncharacterized protein n=1 Tax=Prunus dulcis TaxID=3755 RepID=A0AAD4YRK7_PRUDU|nr:hypothetical protein L3X38_039575 [Prunus dulcis]